MKKSIILIFIMLFFSTFTYGEGDNLDLELDTEKLDKFTHNLAKENDLGLDLTVKDIVNKIIKGEKIIEGKLLKEKIIDIFMEEIKTALSLLSKILIITIISSILNSFQNSFEDSSISELSNIIVYMIVAMLVITSFNEIMAIAKASINNMITFMQLLLPLLLMFLTVTGGPNTNIIFHPMIISTVNIIGIIIENFIFPLIYFSFIIGVLSNISERIQLKNLTDLARKTIIFAITGFFTIFIGLLTIYGLSNKIDGISIRTAKFAIDSTVPIVGKFLSDSVDAVIGSINILKNGIGIIGLMILVFIILLPVIKLGVILLIYNLTSAIIEPIAPKNIVNFFEVTSKNFTLILISTMSLGIMFFITITIIVEAGNNLLMLR